MLIVAEVNQVFLVWIVVEQKELLPYCLLMHVLHAHSLEGHEELELYELLTLSQIQNRGWALVNSCVICNCNDIK